MDRLQPGWQHSRMHEGFSSAGTCAGHAQQPEAWIALHPQPPVQAARQWQHAARGSTNRGPVQGNTIRTWSMKVLTGALARWPNVRVIVPHHCKAERRQQGTHTGHRLDFKLLRRASTATDGTAGHQASEVTADTRRDSAAGVTVTLQWLPRCTQQAAVVRQNGATHLDELDVVPAWGGGAAVAGPGKRRARLDETGKG